MEWCAAGGEHREAWHGVQQVGYRRRRCDHMLEVVEYQQQVAVLQGAGQTVEKCVAGNVRDVEVLRDSQEDECRIPQMRDVN